MIPPGLFVTATGTSAGKTLVTRGLARALRRRGARVAALKPVETGCAPEPLDAVALARACGRPAVAHAPGFHRGRAPLSPYAATLAGEPAPPPVAALAEAVSAAAAAADFVLVEGAGGLLVPLSRTEALADLAAALRLPLLLVAPDALGVLSHATTAVEAARARRLDLAAIVLTRPPASEGDASRAHNGAILAELGLPVLVFGPRAAEDDALADEAEGSGLLTQTLG